MSCRDSLRAAAFFACFALSVFVVPAAAYAAPGELLKIPGNTAVYYIADDGKRYVFPNENTYFTWYPDFSGVRTISPEEMATYLIGGNVVYRPGTRLAKIASDPRVYAVERHGTLRFIENESTARTLYGAEWAKLVDDVPDAFYVNYTQGRLLTAEKYPDGTVLRRVSDGAYFRIEDDGMKRRMVTTAVRTALRVQERFVINAPGSLGEYPDGADLSVSEASFADAAQRPTGGIVVNAPTFSVEGPGTAYLARGSESALLKIRINSPYAVNVTRISVKLLALRDDRPSSREPYEDEDLGGLLYGLAVTPNLRGIRMETASGTEPFARQELQNMAALDQVQTVTFNGSLAVAANEETVLYLRADVQSLVPLNEGYMAMLIGAGVVVVSPATGEAVIHQPVTEVAGPAVTVRENGMRVSAMSAGQITAVRGATDVPISTFRFEASPLSSNRISQITFQGYIDDESSGQYGAGSDIDNGSETRVQHAVPRISLVDATGKRLAGPVDVPYDGRVTFTNLPIVLAPGDAATFTVRGDTNKDLETEDKPDKVAFDIIDAGNDVVVRGDAGERIIAEGLIPNGGTSASYAVNIKRNGSAEWSWEPQGGTIIAGREFVIGTLNAKTKDDGFALKALAFTQETLPSPLAAVRVEYRNAAGATVSIPGSLLGSSVLFTGTSIPLRRDTTNNLVLYGTMQSRQAGAAYGSVVRVRFETGGPFELISDTNGRTLGSSVLGTTDFPITRNVVSGTDLRFSKLQVLGSSYPLATYRDVTATAFGFALKAEPEGAVRVKRLTFAITPTDVATSGPNNDALERWADINGDFQDDDGVVTLKLRPPGGTATVIGEDLSTQISYAIVRHGGRHAASSTLESITTDYAIIDYVFSEGNEISIGAGGVQEFVLEMDLNLLDYTSDRRVTVELRGGTDLEWTDIPFGAYTPRTDAVGVPMQTTISLPE